MSTKVPAQAPSAGPVFVEGFCDPHRRRLVLVAAILASSLGFIDGTVVTIALPAMRESFGATLSQAQWFNNAYILTLSSLILTGGALGDRFGLARVFGLGIALFVGASLACAAATSPTVLIWARAAQGTGAAMMVPGSLAIIARAYPREERGRAIGTWAAASALTTALGPIIGGLALTLGGPEMWRWIFAINLPFGALAIGLLVRAVRQDGAGRDTPVDIPGAVLVTLGLLLLAAGLTGAEHELGSFDLRLVGGGALALLAFLAVQARGRHPMMPLTLFRAPVFSVANLASFFLYFALSAVFFFLPMTVIAGWGVTEIEASAAFAPLSAFIFLLSSRAGALATRIGPGPLLTAGALLVAAGYTLLALAAPAQNYWGHVLPAMCLVGLGMALVVAPLSTAIMGAVDEGLSGTASGINNAVTRVAQLLAVASLGSVAALAYAQAGGTVSFGIASQAPGHTQAMNAAFQTVAWISAAICLLSVAASAIGLRGVQASSSASQ